MKASKIFAFSLVIILAVTIDSGAAYALNFELWTVPYVEVQTVSAPAHEVLSVFQNWIAFITS